MAREYFEHTTSAGERWDMIADKYYGDAMLIQPLLLANPDIVGRIDTPPPLVFSAGVVVRVPVLDEGQIAQPQLPPWKR
ncbi:tail protein X [Epibacterium ulvae]|uniref:tail protein X n=1 Tax=Epibacterium ulvae TaxID=1156985 RepID=UPI002490C00E|nr:tail protein X [Epibacterium ulvae]